MQAAGVQPVFLTLCITRKAYKIEDEEEIERVLFLAVRRKGDIRYVT